MQATIQTHMQPYASTLKWAHLSETEVRNNKLLNTLVWIQRDDSIPVNPAVK